jgi:hypothetical protein
MTPDVLNVTKQLRLVTSEVEVASLASVCRHTKLQLSNWLVKNLSAFAQV